jgi:hypothetical protein
MTSGLARCNGSNGVILDEDLRGMSACVRRLMPYRR